MGRCGRAESGGERGSRCTGLQGRGSGKQLRAPGDARGAMQHGRRRGHRDYLPSEPVGDGGQGSLQECRPVGRSPLGPCFSPGCIDRPGRSSQARSKRGPTDWGFEPLGFIFVPVAEVWSGDVCCKRPALTHARRETPGLGALLWKESCPPNSGVQALAPGPQREIVFGDKASEEVIKVKGRY